MKSNSIGDGMFATFKHLRDCFGHDERGAVLVEMTLITPLMILLSAGVFEFGNFFHQKLLIEAGLDDAARYYARCNTATQACATNAQNIARFGTTAGGTARVAKWTQPVVITATDCVAAYDAATNTVLYRSNKATVCTVRASTTFQYDGAGLLGYLGLTSITLASSHEERVIGW